MVLASTICLQVDSKRSDDCTHSWTQRIHQQVGSNRNFVFTILHLSHNPPSLLTLLRPFHHPHSLHPLLPLLSSCLLPALLIPLLYLQKAIARTAQCLSWLQALTFSSHLLPLFRPESKCSRTALSLPPSRTMEQPKFGTFINWRAETSSARQSSPTVSKVRQTFLRTIS